MARLPAAMRDALCTLLAATSEPTDAKLNAEAERAYPGTLAPSLLARGTYIAGARREGRR